MSLLQLYRVVAELQNRVMKPSSKSYSISKDNVGTTSVFKPHRGYMGHNRGVCASLREE